MANLEYKKKIISGEISDREAARDISPNEWDRIAKQLKALGKSTIPYSSILDNVDARTATIKAQMNRRLEDALVAADLNLAIQARSNLLQAKLIEGRSRNQAQIYGWLERIQSGDLTAWGEPPSGGGLQSRWVNGAIELTKAAMEKDLNLESFQDLVDFISKKVTPYQNIQKYFWFCLGDKFWSEEINRLHEEGSLNFAEKNSLLELHAEYQKLREFPDEPLLELAEPYLMDDDDSRNIKKLHREGNYSNEFKPGWSHFVQIIPLPFDTVLRRDIWIDYWLPQEETIEANLRLIKARCSGVREIKIKGKSVQMTFNQVRLQRSLIDAYPNLPIGGELRQDILFRSKVYI